MLQEFKEHFRSTRGNIRERLKEFERLKHSDDELLFEEMTFCVFAANSSAKMGLLAVELLKPVLKEGNLQKYKEAVHKKVRFYSKRSEYLHHNKEKILEMGGLRKNLEEIQDNHKRRMFIKEKFKGFGLKESSHFLRNIGYKGYCIIDKHVLNMMNDLGVLKSNKPPRNEEEYLKIERKIKKFANENGYDVDELDLALWSYKTGEIIK